MFLLNNFLCYHVGFVLQPMNVFGYGSQAVQHAQTTIPPSSSSGPLNGAVNNDDTVRGKMGKSLIYFSFIRLQQYEDKASIIWRNSTSSY